MKLAQIKKSIGYWFLLSILSAFISYGGVEIETVHERISTKQIALGLTYEHKEKLTSAGWVDIHVMKIDLAEPSLTMDIVRNQGVFGSKEKLSSMTNQNPEFVGAINGAFFSMGHMQSDTIGGEIRQGKVSTMPNQYNLNQDGVASLCVGSADTFIDFIDSEIMMTTASGQRVYLEGINRKGTKEGVSIYNRNAYETTALIDAARKVYKVVVEKGVVLQLAAPTETVAIPEDGYVVIFPENQEQVMRTLFFEGMYVTLDVKSKVNLKALETAISGGGMILENGEVVEKGLIVEPKKRHPRTAIGLSADQKTLIVMVVDGRGESIGATHAELAKYLLEYHVNQAMHTDGGGSSTLVARTLGGFGVEVKNRPSSGYERAIVNGLGFVSKAEKVEDYAIYLEVEQTRVFINNGIKLKLVGYDQNFNPVKIETQQIAWGMAGGYGLMQGDTFIPKEAGEVTLTAYYKGHSVEKKITVVDQLIDLEITPKIIHFNDGIQSFKVIGTDINGYKTVLDNQLLEWSINQPIGTIHQGIFIGTTPSARAKIEVRYKNVKENAYVLVDEQIQPLLEDVGTVTVQAYPKTVQGSVIKDQGTIQITYDFQKSKVAQAVYAVFEHAILEKGVDRLTLKAEGLDEGVLLKAYLTDASDEQYTIRFKKTSGQKMMAVIPSNLTYPVKMSRLYVVTHPLEERKTSTVILSDLEAVTHEVILDSTQIQDYPPLDPLYKQVPEQGREICIFGATSNQNRLLDRVIMDKVYRTLNQADYAIYAGKSRVDTEAITNDYLSDQNQFKVVDLDEARIITLGMGENSLVKTDSSQWEKLQTALSSSIQKTLIIIGTEKLVNNTDRKFVKEGQLIHESLSDFVEKSGKTLFYINASGYQNNLGLYEGVRYIDLNGLWYQVSKQHGVDLYDSFKTLNLTFKDGKVTYRVEDLYPKITIQS